MVTCRSSIASSRADCVLAGARLISSPSRTLVKTGPRLQVKWCWLQVENVGADDVGGHEVGRELHPLELGLQGRGERVRHQRLGDARHAFQQHMPVGQQRHQQQIERPFCPTITF